MGILDIIYNMVNKSKQKKAKKPKQKHEKHAANNGKTGQVQETKQKLEQKIIVKDLSDTEKLLKAWDSSVKNVSDHPLSQVKIINTQILEQLTDILTSMNSKLDRLDVLEEILRLLKDSRAEIRVVGGSTEKLDAAISKIEGLTIKDEEFIRVLKDKGPQSADSISRLVGISRSTASSRLNKLEKFKLVKKNADGKDIYYSLNQ
ncbi:Helix-turn-helix domain protein [Candidatus Tiddalikarchaeum anstoanum]|nr:Helix-turn-helix domain protein [Candidatus Tiddalikarchaeum anstoanum]